MGTIGFKPRSSDFSTENALALALCSKLAYKPQNDTARKKLAEHGFKCHFLNCGDTQGFIAFNQDAVVLTFRGTESIADWMTDSYALLTPMEEVSGKVHSGFLWALDLVWDDILQILQKVQKNSQPLWITGHSLGGALATLAAIRLAMNLDKPINGVYTFGQPRVCDRNLARLLNQELKTRFFRFVNNNDIVTRLPTREMNYSHVGRLDSSTPQGCCIMT